jgi:hypothetical protein
MTNRPIMLWFGIVSQILLACGVSDEQRLPVIVTVDAQTRDLQWSDEEGVLRAEVPWVLRRDVMGPDTYLIAEVPGSGRQCVEEATFRVVPIAGVEYRVKLVSDLHGTISWNVQYGESKDVRLIGCTPRHTGGTRDCLEGGIPKSLFGVLEGAVRARPAGGESKVVVEALRFEQTPPEC